MNGRAAATPSLMTRLQDAWRMEAHAVDVALEDGRETLRYPALLEAVASLAGRLRAAGIGPGDRVALTLAQSARFVVALLAVLASGACVCPLEPRLGRDETRRRFALARLRWVLGDGESLAHPSLADVDAARRLDLDALPSGDTGWSLDVPDDAPALLLFTSGSSGAPKGVLLGHRNLLNNALGVIAHTGLTRDDRLLHVMPMHHTNGVNNQIIAPLIAGASVFVAERFRAEEMPVLMRRVRPTIVTGVPTMFARMLPCAFEPASLASLRMLRCGSAPITPELHRHIEAKFERPLVVSYGLSEATCTSTMNPPAARRIGSVGTILAGQEVRLQGSDGTFVDVPDREGEICIGGPSVMLGYLTEASNGRPEATGGMIHTGDLGRFDADGFVYITGRLKDVIIRGGENLSPQAIENVLCEAAGVAASCVVGRPNDDLGEVPVAYVVRESGVEGDALDAEELGRIVVERLSRIHRPAEFFFVASLPENGVGKIDRKVLAARARAGATVQAVTREPG